MNRILCFVLCLVFLLSTSSCDSFDEIINTEKLVAVKYASPNEKAADEFVSDGYKTVTYNSSSDVVLAVENKKTQAGILDEIEYSKFIREDRDIVIKSTCGYSLDYCVYFNSDSAELQNKFDKAIELLEEEGTLDQVKSAYLNGEKYKIKSKNCDKTLIALCDPSFENRVCVDENGVVVGLDVNLVRAVCAQLNYDIRFVVTDFEDAFVKLEDGEGDFIISATEINEQREKYYLTSIPYLTLKYYLIERK